LKGLADNGDLAGTDAAPLTTCCKLLAGSSEENLPGAWDQAPLVLTKEWAMRRLIQILKCEKGANAIEYALVASLIAIAAVGAFNNLGDKIDTMYNNVSNHLG